MNETKLIKILNRRVVLFGPALLGAAAMLVSEPTGRSQDTSSRETPPLRLVQEIPLPGIQGRLDHFTIDPKRKRVIFSALGYNEVEVVDVFAGLNIHSIKGQVEEPQGTLYVPDVDELFVASTVTGEVKIFNGKTYALVGSVDFKDNADNLRYDAKAKRVYVGYGDGDEGAIGVIDATTNKRINTDYHLEEHPESFQIEAKGNHLFVNIAAKNCVMDIDRSSGKMTKWELPKLAANFPMALDEDTHRIFIVCRKPAHLVVIDTTSGKIVFNKPCSGDSDDVYWDAARKRIYVAGGEGYISVFEQQDADNYTEMAKIPTSVGARTGAWYAKRDKIYLAAPPHGTQPASLLVLEAQD